MGLNMSQELEGDKIEEGKLRTGVGGALGNIAGRTVGGAIAGPAGAEVGKFVGAAGGAAAMAKKGKKGRAATGGALGTVVPGLGLGLGSGAGAAIAASHELEGDTIEETSEKLAQKAQSFARAKGVKRRKIEGSNRGMYKSERQGYNLAQSQRSSNSELETQRGPQTGGGGKSFGFASNKSNPIKSKTYAGSGNKAKRRMDAMKKEEVNPSVQQALEALNSHVKKKSNLGEEGYDIARDRGMVKPSKDKKDATTMPVSKEVKNMKGDTPMQKEFKKKYGAKATALDAVKQKYKGQIMGKK